MELHSTVAGYYFTHLPICLSLQQGSSSMLQMLQILMSSSGLFMRLKLNVQVRFDLENRSSASVLYSVLSMSPGRAPQVKKVTCSFRQAVIHPGHINSTFYMFVRNSASRQFPCSDSNCGSSILLKIGHMFHSGSHM